MKALHQKLGYGLLGVSIISAIISMVSHIPMGYAYGIFNKIVFDLIFQILLSYTILRDKNDRFTMISIILITIFTFNIGGITAFILRLILRKDDSETIRKCWFVPGMVAGVSYLIRFRAFTTGLFYFTFFICDVLLNVAFYLIFGYWFIKYLKLDKRKP